MLKTYINKMEYQKILDKQVLEKQLQRAHDQKVREMEEIIEGLRISRERLMKELESNSITPKGKIAHQKLYKQSNSQPPTNRHNKHPQHTQGGSPIIIQPGDMNPRSNKSLLHNHSSKRTLLDNKLSSRRDLHEKPETEHSSPQLNLHEQAQSELRKLREELRQNNKRFQDQIYDVKNFLKKPSDYSKPFRKEPPRIKESDSKISLANESKLVPFQSSPSPTKSEKESPDNHLPVNKTHGLESPRANSENHFAHPKVIHNTLTLNSSETHQHTPERVTSNIDKEALDKLLNFAATIENSVKHQNLELRKEMNDLKQQISKLLEGKGDRLEYDSIQSRLSQLKSDNKDFHSTDTKKISPVAQNSHIESKLSEPSTLQTNITKNKIEPGKSVDNRNTLPSTTEEKQNPQNVHNQKNIEPPKVDQKTINSLDTDVSKPRKLSKVMQLKVGESQNSVPNNSESQMKNNTESHPQIEKSKILHPRDTSNFSLKKCVRGSKRSIRTGEEEFFKKF